MARKAEFSINGLSVMAELKKVDRKKIYGWSTIEVFDQNGSKCKLAGLAEGQYVMPSGSSALVSLNAKGEAVSKITLVGVDSDGKKVEKVPSSDAFNLPDSSCNSEDLELLKLGCNQILEGRGFSSQNPFKNLGIRGCHKLFKLFHFKFVNQTVTKVEGGMLDKMIFKHIMDKKNVSYYNLVSK